MFILLHIHHPVISRTFSSLTEIPLITHELTSTPPSPQARGYFGLFYYHLHTITFHKCFPIYHWSFYQRSIFLNLCTKQQFFFFVDRVLLHTPGWPWTHTVAQHGLELTAILLPQLPSAGTTGVHHHAWLRSNILEEKCKDRMHENIPVSDHQWDTFWIANHQQPPEDSIQVFYPCVILLSFSFISTVQYDSIKNCYLKFILK